MGELKFKDFSVNTTTASANGTILSTSLNLINQGNGENEMIGRKVTLRAISINFTVEGRGNTAANPANLQANRCWRLVMVLDKQCNGAAATIAQLYNGATIRTFKNLENNKRFRILREWTGSIPATIAYDSNTPTWGIAPGCVFKSGYYPCKHQILFGNQDGAQRVIGEVKSNNVFLIAFSSNGTCDFTCTIRIRYEDE